MTTTLPAILAEELRADWSRVRVEYAPVADAYRNPRLKWMFTGNSESTPTFFDLLRPMGASAREMLIAAAADRWGVPTSVLRTTGYGPNIFVMESFIDELAHRAHADPYLFRRGLLKNERSLVVLDLAADKAGRKKPAWMPYKNLGIAEDVPGYIQAHREALSYDFDLLVAGHVDRLGTRQDVETSLQFVNVLKATVSAAMQKLDFPSYLRATASTKHRWDRHNDYEKAWGDQCCAQLFPRWSTRLAGAET